MISNENEKILSDQNRRTPSITKRKVKRKLRRKTSNNGILRHMTNPAKPTLVLLKNSDLNWLLFALILSQIMKFCT